MQPASVAQRGSVNGGMQYQRGQALIYGIFILISSLSALFFLFNTGQLSSEKTKLVNTADAVAYSAGVMHARALNFDAYNNRALVANEVLVAQMVSLSSWASYADMQMQNLPSIFPECVNEVTAGYNALTKYDPVYGAMCYLTLQRADSVITPATNAISQISGGLVSGVEVSKKAITAAQAALHTPLFFERARSDVMQAVADRNYQGDGTVTAGPLLVSTMTDDWKSFTHHFVGDERIRLANVARTAASSDSFVRQRNWTSTAIFPPPGEWKCALLNRKNSVRRQGGTDLLGLEEWQAEDTESFWRVHNTGRWWEKHCDENEIPIAYAGREAASNPAGNDSGALLGGSPLNNPFAHASVNSNVWPQYTGISTFYDLSTSNTDPQSTNLREAQDPSLKFAVRLVRDKTAVRTSDGASQIRPSPRLNNFNSNLASQQMVAIATSEVYFNHPPEQANAGSAGISSANRNQYAVSQNNLATRELGSLFNPYWQVRLITNNPGDIASQQTLQGAVMP